MENEQTFVTAEVISPKSKAVAALLCFFLGELGIHRFYVGKIGTGILYLCTLGFCGIGVLIDFIMILCGSFKDSTGAFLKN
ncbi:MAG: TM2 domain-containing protein [Eubacterium sp.]|nr:TM2 domain-containing protein [Eubacterium sp.]